MLNSLNLIILLRLSKIYQVVLNVHRRTSNLHKMNEIYMKSKQNQKDYNDSQNQDL